MPLCSDSAWAIWKACPRAPDANSSAQTRGEKRGHTEPDVKLEKLSTDHEGVKENTLETQQVSIDSDAVVTHNYRQCTQTEFLKSWHKPGTTTNSCLPQGRDEPVRDRECPGRPKQKSFPEHRLQRQSGEAANLISFTSWKWQAGFHLLLLATVIAKKEQMGWKISARGVEMPRSQTLIMGKTATQTRWISSGRQRGFHFTPNNLGHCN